jgi:hypothetical protein
MTRNLCNRRTGFVTSARSTLHLEHYAEWPHPERDEFNLHPHALFHFDSTLPETYGLRTYMVVVHVVG